MVHGIYCARSKTTCPYCKKVKELFKSLGANAKIIEINQEGTPFYNP